MNLGKSAILTLAAHANAGGFSAASFVAGRGTGIGLSVRPVSQVRSILQTSNGKRRDLLRKSPGLLDRFGSQNTVKSISIKCIHENGRFSWM